MSILAATAAWQPSSVARRARWFLLALHLPVLAIAPSLLLGYASRSEAAVAFLLALALELLQLRHSLAAAGGGRPRAWPATLAGVVLLTYLPLPWLGWNWMSTQFFAVASALMLLPRRLAVALVAATFVGVPAAAVVQDVVINGEGLVVGLWLIVYWLVGLAAGGLGLYGAARLVHLLDELEATRAELAELEVGRERLRVSRDLHDLLGHSLSAVALKGDLAIRLQRRDPAAARAEIVGLSEIAGEALRSLRTIAHGGHVVSLRTEAAGAAALLRAADVDARVELAVGELPPAIDEVLAWTVREGVTNVLRHAEARSCSIVGARDGDAVRLEILNDGVPPAPAEASADGRGLAGLEARARTVGGSLSAARTADGHFRLSVEVAAHAAGSG